MAQTGVKVVKMPLKAPNREMSKRQMQEKRWRCYTGALNQFRNEYYLVRNGLYYPRGEGPLPKIRECVDDVCVYLWMYEQMDWTCSWMYLCMYLWTIAFMDVWIYE